MAQQIQAAPVSTAVKMLGEGGRVGGYLVVWGDDARRDLQGEYFSPETDRADWYRAAPSSTSTG